MSQPEPSFLGIPMSDLKKIAEFPWTPEMMDELMKSRRARRPQMYREIARLAEAERNRAHLLAGPIKIRAKKNSLELAVEIGGVA